MSNNIIQLYTDDAKTQKGYPITSAKLVINEKGGSIEDFQKDIDSRQKAFETNTTKRQDKHEVDMNNKNEANRVEIKEYVDGLPSNIKLQPDKPENTNVLWIQPEEIAQLPEMAQEMMNIRLGTAEKDIKKVNSSLAEIPNQYPKKGNVIVSDINKNLGKFDQTYMTDEFLQQMAGNTPINATVSARGITTDKLNEKSVNELKTTFINRNINIFNKNGVVVDNGYYAVNGVFNSSQSYYTILMIVEPGKVYNINTTNAPTIYNLAYLDINKNKIDGVIGSSSGWTQITVPNNNNIYYATLTFKKDHSNGNPDTVVVCEGVVPSQYVEYGYTLSENIKLLPNHMPTTLLKTENKNMLVFGDSITESAFVSEDGLTYVESGNSGTVNSWVNHTKLDLKLKAYKNYARSGATYKNQSIPGDRRKSMSEQIKMAIANKDLGDIVVFSCGTNDGSGSIGNYDTAMSKTTLDSLDMSLLFESMRWCFWTIKNSYPNAEIYVATPIQRTAYEPPSALIEAIIKMAKRYNCIIIDGTNESGIVRDFEVAGGEGRYLVDGLHPNATGKRKMAKLYSRTILNTYY